MTDPLEALKKGSADSSLKVWEIARRKEVRSIPLGKVFLSAPLAFSGDGERVAVWTLRREDAKEGMPAPPVKVWDVRTGKEVKDLKEKPRLDKEKLRLDVRTSKNFFQDRQGGSVTALGGFGSAHLSFETVDREISVPNKAGFLFSHPGNIITVQDRKTKKTVELKGHRSGLKTLGVSADEKYLASAADYGDIKIWDLVTKKQVGRISRGAGGTPGYMVFSPDNKLLLISPAIELFNPKMTGHETIELFDLISVSAGQRGLQIILSPADYLRASEATLADLTKASAGESR